MRYSVAGSIYAYKGIKVTAHATFLGSLPEKSG